MSFPLPSPSVSMAGAALTPPVPTFLQSQVVLALATARRLLNDEGAVRRVVREALVGVETATDQSAAECLRERVVKAAVAEHRAALAHEPEINRLLPRFRADGHHVRSPTSMAAPARAPSPTEVRAAIERLPREHRLVLLLHDVEGMALTSAATCLGVDPALARARLQQSRLALCELLGARA